MHNYKLSFVTTLLILVSTVSQAETLHWWRFEGEDILSDHAGGVQLDDTLSFNSTGFALPDEAGARGSFPSELGQFQNKSALEFSDTRHGLFTNDSTAVTGDYTIEAFVHFDDLSLHNQVGAVIATQNFALIPWQFSWMLQVRTDGFEGAQFGELAAWNSDGSAFEFLKSGMILEERTDYYVAGSFDLSNREYTFYLQNLTSGEELQSMTVPHTRSRLEPDSYFLVGGRNGFTGAGLIDEVRFSDEVLAIEELLPNFVSSFNFDCDGDDEVGVSDLNCISSTQLGDFFETTGLIQGDANGDGSVAFEDFLTLSAGFGSEGSYANGDFDLSGKIDFSDFLILSANFGQTSNSVAAVPETSSLPILLVGAIAVVAYRKRRR